MANTLTRIYTDSMVIKLEDMKDNELTMDGYKFRIRKLTPTECFRLMDVDDKYIEILVNALAYDRFGNLRYFKKEPKQLISNSKLYQLAGNSIVTNCMTLMFENLFYPTNEPERGDQLSLF